MMLQMTDYSSSLNDHHRHLLYILARSTSTRTRTASTFPTSFYGVALHGQSYEMEGSMNMVGGASAQCWIATQIMRTVSSDGRERRWQWELRWCLTLLNWL